MNPPRVWLITGASSGLGKALTEVALRHGDIVVATLRKPSVLAPLAERYPASQLLLLSLDVTHPSDIFAAFTRTKEAFGRLDVVFNNAGYGMVGEVEGTSDPDARALFDVNFWGVVSVSRAAIKFFREVNPPGKGGVILQNSSMATLMGTPGAAFYTASKHAVSGFSESLLAELPPAWNIRICILQTGAFDTNAITAAQFIAPHPAYAGSVTAFLRDVYKTTTAEGDPNKFAEMLHRLVVSEDHGKKIPLFLPVGEDALEKFQDRLKVMNKALEDATPWSVDLKKDHKGKSDL